MLHNRVRTVDYENLLFCGNQQDFLAMKVLENPTTRFLDWVASLLEQAQLFVEMAAVDRSIYLLLTWS